MQQHLRRIAVIVAALAFMLCAVSSAGAFSRKVQIVSLRATVDESIAYTAGFAENYQPEPEHCLDLHVTATTRGTLRGLGEISWIDWPANAYGGAPSFDTQPGPRTTIRFTRVASGRYAASEGSASPQFTCLLADPATSTLSTTKRACSSPFTGFLSLQGFMSIGLIGAMKGIPEWTDRCAYALAVPAMSTMALDSAKPDWKSVRRRFERAPVGTRIPVVATYQETSADCNLDGSSSIAVTECAVVHTARMVVTWRILS